MNHLTDLVLQELVDGVLSGEPLEQARRHLTGCPDCQARFAEYQALFGDLELLPAPPPPLPRFTAEVMARVAARDALLARQKRVAAFTLVGSAALAATCFLAAGSGAWARQVSHLFSTALQLTRFSQLVADCGLPVLMAWRLPLLALMVALCVPSLLALHRSIQPRAQAA